MLKEESKDNLEDQVYSIKGGKNSKKVKKSFGYYVWECIKLYNFNSFFVLLFTVILI